MTSEEDDDKDEIHVNKARSDIANRNNQRREVQQSQESLAKRRRVRNDLEIAVAPPNTPATSLSITEIGKVYSTPIPTIETPRKVVQQVVKTQQVI